MPAPLKLAQHRRSMHSAGVRIVEWCGGGHPHADGDRHGAIAQIRRKREGPRLGHVQRVPLWFEAAELPNHAAIYEHLVNVIDIFRHLKSQLAVLATLHIVLNVDPQSIPRITGVARKSARGPSRHKPAVAGDRVI